VLVAKQRIGGVKESIFLWRDSEKTANRSRAMHVFWRKGFEGASLNDLKAAMGLQPASLYQAFGNKRALFEKALARYLAGLVAFVHDALSERTALAVAERILRRTAEFLTEGGRGAGV
jgi:AcrR family transcriptional regulator